MENSEYRHKLRKPEPVKYLAALTIGNMEILEECKHDLEIRYGEVDHTSPFFAFDHSDYYETEMGAKLRKQFLSFKELQLIENFVKMKLSCIELETKFSIDGRRQVNIDPAYLELAKLVVATRKNFDHRIYLGHGVYGDVQLRFRNGEFVASGWTYPDYSSVIVINFLKMVRNTYNTQLKQLR